MIAPHSLRCLPRLRAVRILLLWTLAAASVSFCADKPLIYPVPLETHITGGQCTLDTGAVILLPEGDSQADNLLARLLAADLAGRHGLAVRTLRLPGLTPSQPFILAGTLENPLVRRYCDEHGLTALVDGLGDEGYCLQVSEKGVVIAAKGEAGALYGVESLRQLMRSGRGTVTLPQLTVQDKPRFPFRGIKLYLPGRDNIPFFRRFIRDFVVRFKFNTIILELNANMRLERHPELNVGAVQFAKALRYGRLSDPNGINNKSKNSSHYDNADGEILEKEEVADLVRYMREFHLEVIPELPSLPHSYYLLAGHRDLAENKNEVYPDTYCPLQPGSYRLYFDVLDEYIDVIHPRMIHVGHDEWRMEKDECELCKGKDYPALYAQDLTKIHDYLASKGISTAIWGDHLIESVRGKDPRVTKSSTGYVYKVPGALRPEQVEKLIPKDILVFNWFWDDRYDPQIAPQLSRWGFKQVFGNMRADFTDYANRSNVSGILGGAPSSWSATTEMNFGKDQILNFLGCANMLWSEHLAPFDSLVFTVQALVHDVHRDFTGRNLPSDDGYPVVPLDLSSVGNTSLADLKEGPQAARFLTGDVRAGSLLFRLPEATGKSPRSLVARQASSGGAAGEEAKAVPVHEDVSSLVFLHACAKNAANRKVYYNISNFDETADLLGWYEVVYEDGLILTIPIRYGVNILDWGWRQRILRNEKETIHYNQDKYAYAADAVPVEAGDGEPVTFFAHEWRNPRFGEPIREVRLKAAPAKEGAPNAVVLLALSVVRKGEILQELTRTAKR